MSDQRPPPEGMILYPSGLIGYANPGGTVQGLDVPLPGTFITGVGSNEFDLTASGFLGVQGYIDLHLTLSTPPGLHEAHLLFALYDDISGAAILAHLQGRGNKVLFSHIDPTGTTVASTALVGNYPEGTALNLIYLWDSQYPVTEAGEYALAAVDMEQAPWTTEPLTPFTAFAPTKLIVGQPYIPAGYTLPFLGTIQISHLSNNGHPTPPTNGSLSALPWPAPGPGPGPWPRPWPRPKPWPPREL